MYNKTTADCMQKCDIWVFLHLSVPIIISDMKLYIWSDIHHIKHAASKIKWSQEYYRMKRVGRLFCTWWGHLEINTTDCLIATQLPTLAGNTSIKEKTLQKTILPLINNNLMFLVDHNVQQIGHFWYWKCSQILRFAQSKTIDKKSWRVLEALHIQ